MDANVLIAGAGPTGLFLASELARLGVPVTVIEKGEGLSVNSKALTIHARTLEAFSTRGLAAPFVKKGLETERVRIFVGGTQRAELPLYEIDSAYAYILILPQSDTEEMLLERFQSLGGTVQWGTELVDLTVEDDQVMARVADGEGERRLQAQWLVGCDGAHSRVRRAHEIEWTGDDIDLHFALMDAHLQSEVIEDETFQVFVLKDGRVAGFIPLPDGRQRVIMALSGPVEETDLDRRFFQEQFATHVHEGIDVAEADWISHFTARQRVAGTFRDGRVFLTGDAAHAHSPAGGQGMNVGLQDAHNLAWKLAAVFEDRADARLLDSYDAERRPVAETIVRRTGGATRFGGKQSWWMQALRTTVLSVVPRIRFLRAKVLEVASQQNVDYAERPLVRDAGPGPTGALSMGQFVPDLALANGTMLHDHLEEGKHVGLLPEGASVPPPLAEAFVSVVFVPESVMRKHGLQRREVLVVRPDGYLGYAGPLRADEALSTYLTNERWGRSEGG